MSDFGALLIAVAGSYATTLILAAVLCTRGHLTVTLRRKPGRKTATTGDIR